jgi:hypothetical protein
MESTTMETTQVNESAAVTNGSDSNSETTVERLDKGPYFIEKETFSRGIGKGLCFYSKQYKSVQDAISHLSATGKNGEEIVLALVNQQISSAMRTRATSKFPQDAKPELKKASVQAWIAAGETILVTEQEAETYIPGTREKTSIPGLWKDYNSLKEAFNKAKAAGDIEEASNLREQALAVKARIDDLMKEDELAEL